MAGMRFLGAGSILLIWTRLRQAQRPTRRHWRTAFITGFLMLLIGNGALSWSEQVLPSGIAALIVAIVPLWFVLLEWFQHAIRPRREIVLGLILGTVGMIILIDPARITGADHVDLLGAVVLLFSSVAWAFGSMYSRKAEQPSAPLVGTAMQMLAGGFMLLILSIVSRELVGFDVHQASLTSLAAVAYLIVFGSIIAFSSYVWLLKVSSPSRVSTYAYVNPVIAIFLGWLLAGESLNARILFAALIIVAGVALITSSKVKALATGLLRETKSRFRSENSTRSSDNTARKTDA